MPLRSRAWTHRWPAGFASATPCSAWAPSSRRASSAPSTSCSSTGSSSPLTSRPALTPRVADPSVREAVAAILLPDLELARFLHAECSRGDWAGIITRVWPNAESCVRLEAPAT